jgi:hypothetical protein
MHMQSIVQCIACSVGSIPCCALGISQHGCFGRHPQLNSTGALSCLTRPAYTQLVTLI